MFWNDGHPTLNAVNLSFFLKLFSVNVFHLYFLVIMLGLYCIAPLLRSFLKTAALPTQKNFLLFALLAGMLQVIGQYLFQQCSADTVFTMWVPYTGLFVAGYLLGHNVQSIKKIGRITMLYLLGLGLTLGLNYIHFLFLSHGNDFLNGPGCISHYSDYYLSINVVLMSLCAFLLLLHFQYNKIKNTVVGKLIYSIARASFGIYLVHLLIVQFIEIDLHLTVDQTHMPLLVYVFISWLLVFLISYAISLVIAKIPVLKWAIGAK
jgi:surface polysaccharide O-acyltransferase-like enzyme